MQIGMGIGMGFSQNSLSLYNKLESAAISAARRNNAALWYVPPNLRGVYQDSAGTIAAQVDAPVGLVLDQQYGAGNLGPELVVNGDFNQGLTSWSSGVDWSVINGVAVKNASVNNALQQVSPGTYMRGKTYVLSMQVSDFFSGAFYFGFLGGTHAFSPVYTTNGTFTVILSPAVDNSFFYLGVNPSTALSVDNISVREVLGFSASQATTANKPILRRGLVNLLLNTATNPYSANAGGGSVVVNTNLGGGVVQIDKTGSGGYAESLSRIGATSGQPITVTSVCEVRYVSGDLGSVSFGLGQDAAPFTIAASPLTALGVVADGQWYRVITTQTVTPSNNSVRAATFYIGANNQASIQVRNSAAFFGTVTAAKILAAGGIPLTTNVPASSRLGNYWMQFDGVNDQLTHSLAIGANPQTMIAAIAPLSYPADLSIIANSGAETLAIWSAGQIVAWVGALVNSGQTLSIGEAGTVSSTTAAFNAVEFFKNGVSSGVKTNGVSFTAYSENAIGGRVVGAARPYASRIFLTCAAPGVMPPADRIAIERFAAYHSGAAYV
jgi:hypothetical protein